jgi:hypothetical protein
MEDSGGGRRTTRPARRLPVFFYGLFMDRVLLEEKGVVPVDVHRGVLVGYTLRVAERATLIPEPTGRVHGIVMSLEPTELERLYAEPELRAYEPRAVLVDVDGGRRRRAMCWIAPAAFAAGAPNETYMARLMELGRNLGLPEEYLAEIAEGRR